MNQFVRAFQPDRLQEAWKVICEDFPFAAWETLYATLLATMFAIIIGLPLGMLLVAGDEKGVLESSMREVNPNIIETAQSMGATPLQILIRVMLPEAVPSLITNFTLAITTIMGYTAMSGAVGGGGLGMIAITYGYNRYRYAVLYAAVIVLVILVQVIQSFGTWLATKCDKRLKK